MIFNASGWALYDPPAEIETVLERLHELGYLTEDYSWQDYSPPEEQIKPNRPDLGALQIPWFGGPYRNIMRPIRDDILPPASAARILVTTTDGGYFHGYEFDAGGQVQTIDLEEWAVENFYDFDAEELYSDPAQERYDSSKMAHVAEKFHEFEGDPHTFMKSTIESMREDLL